MPGGPVRAQCRPHLRAGATSALTRLLLLLAHSCLAAYLWPAYATFKALEGDNRNLDEIKKWQQYWGERGAPTTSAPPLRPCRLPAPPPPC